MSPAPVVTLRNRPRGVHGIPAHAPLFRSGFSGPFRAAGTQRRTAVGDRWAEGQQRWSPCLRARPAKVHCHLMFGILVLTVIGLLPGKIRSLPKVLCNAGVDQQSSEFRQCGERDLRLTQFHPCAGHLIEHPARDQCDLTRRCFDTNRLTGGALFNLNHANRESVKVVPRIMDRHDLPDMGRM